MKLFKSSLLFVVVVLFTSNLFATAQYPDKIIYNGKEYSLHSNPMEEYFAKNPHRKPRGGIISSALWRGYVATFEFSENNLILKDIHIMEWDKSESNSHKINWKSVLSEVVPKDEKLKIDWFTGILVIPHGELVNYVHMGYSSTYENYILLELDKGRLNKAKEFEQKDYEKFKERQFEAFKKTAEYQKLLNRMKKEEKFNQSTADGFIKNFVINYSSKILVD